MKKEPKYTRFVRTYIQGGMQGMEIWVDRETGVNYLLGYAGYAGGMTVLLDKDGKPVITEVADENLEKMK